MLKYYVNGDLVSEEDFDKELESSIISYCEEHFDEYLNDLYGYNINLAEDTYTASQLLQIIDEKKYHEIFNDYKEYQYEIAEGELEYGDFIVVGDNEFMLEEAEEE